MVDWSDRRIGEVKFFNPIKGYGFILPPKIMQRSWNSDIFFHYSSIIPIVPGQYRKLQAGDFVYFSPRYKNGQMVAILIKKI